VRPYGLAVADFNKDGKDDVIVTAAGSGDVSIFLGDRPGSLKSLPRVPVGKSLRGVAVGDFNGDGLADLAVVDSDAESVLIMLNNCR